VSDQPVYLRHRSPVSREEVSAENTARLQTLQAVDRAVGSLVETLDEQGVLDDTYIVFSSDNGYSLGEHRFVGKDVLTDEALQVPLLVRGPGIAPGTTSDLPVTLVDLPATFAALTGVTPAWQVDGSSLAPTLLGQDQTFRDTTLIQTGRTLGDGWSHRGVRTERYLYGTDGVDGFLYDRLLDPDETVNLIDDPAFNEDDVTDQPAYLRHLSPVSPAEVSAENTARLEALQSVDRAVGSLVETLDEQGVLDDTYIVFSSDNGYSLGEHRFVGKDVLTDEALQVPLLVRGPGIAPGSTSDLPVSLVDLPVTFAGLTGVSPAWQVDGTSLLPTLRGQDQVFRDTTLIQTGRTLGNGWSHRGVRTSRSTCGTAPPSRARR
jgi:arylsulfatase A-like enzyme